MANNARHAVFSPKELTHHVIFGTDGLRGRVGTSITPSLVLQLGYWCGHVLPREGPVITGQDSRQSGSMLTAA